MQEHQAAVRRTKLAFLGIELLFGTVIAFVGPLTVSGPIGKLAALHLVGLLLRLVIGAAHLQSAFEPAERWARAAPERRTDAMTRAAAISLQRAPGRQTLLWAVTFSSTFVLSNIVVVYVLRDPTVSDRLLIGVFGAALAIFFGSLVIGFPIGEALTSGLHAEVMRTAAERRLDVAPVTTSVQRRIAVLALGLVVAPQPWFAGIGYRSSNDAARDEALERVRVVALRAAVDLTAEAVDRGGNTTLQLVAASDPDACVSAARASAAREASFLDVRAERASACRELPDGRFAVATTVVSTTRGNTFFLMAAGFMLVLALWGPITAMFFGRFIVLPITRLGDATRRITEVGDIGAMGSLPVPYDDELGALTVGFNALLGNLRTLSATAGAVAGGDLSVSLEGRGELADAFRGMLERLRDVVKQIRETSVQLASAAAEIYSATQEQEAASAQQSAGMVEVSRTMESLSGSAGHIAESVRGVLADTERTRENTDQMALRIAELNGHAQRIGELLEVIRDVADKSDLLALNGSLEATHAGEGGRGFSLIAGEMRRLAERVTATVANVRQLLADVRASGSSAVMATEQSRKVAESTSEAARRINLIVQQQRTATDAVSTSVKDVTTIVGQAAIATTQTRVSAEHLKTQSDHLGALVHRFVLQRAQ